MPTDWASKTDLTLEEVSELNQLNIELSNMLAQKNPSFSPFQHGNFSCIMIKEVGKGGGGRGGRGGGGGGGGVGEDGRGGGGGEGGRGWERGREAIIQYSLLQLQPDVNLQEFIDCLFQETASFDENRKVS